MFCVTKFNASLSRKSSSKLKVWTPKEQYQQFHWKPREYSSLQQAIPFVNKIFDKVQKASIELPSTTSTMTTTITTAKVVQNPFDMVTSDLSQLKENIVQLLTTDHPFLKLVAKYYLDLKGKRFRPMIVILLSRAIDSHRTKQRESTVTRRQLQLAEIIEMIHTASIIHDDVIDESTTRRGVTAINHNFTNKLAVLAGDYLLARASVSLASLEHHEVTRLISTVISDLVEGEFMQLKPNPTSSAIFEYYLRKTYLKTASLITNGCKCAALLSNASPHVVQIASEYGENLGLAFQVCDNN
jgi:geranylgeranyl pyrophosphate synthase